MAESKKYKKDELLEYSIDELEALVIQEQSYINNGETLLDAILKVPFKNKEKFNKIKENISIHNENITEIRKIIYDLKNPIYNTSDLSGICLTDGTYIISNTTLHFNFNLLRTPITKVKYVDMYRNVLEGELIDDVFQSVTSDYYMMTTSGNVVSLNSILEIDPESKTGKWYEMMCKNFERNEKLKRVLKDGDNKTDSE